jgi:2-polyprenyl-3-methyl-5-hydroxy-6-metoxy-1,4-benzoquinol methylase
MTTASGPEYTYNAVADPEHQPLYLAEMLKYLRAEPNIRTILDVGCGHGSFAASLAEAGFQIFGVDMSDTGVAASRARNIGSFEKASAYDDLRGVFPGQTSFDAVVAVEVIEHLYSPRVLVRRVNEVLEPGGLFIITTPYWGYWKNIALSITGRLDTLLTALWDGGHIKHWSRRTLTILLKEQGFEEVGFYGAGKRPPYLWAGMMMVFRKPR